VISTVTPGAPTPSSSPRVAGLELFHRADNLPEDCVLLGMGLACRHAPPAHLRLAAHLRVPPPSAMVSGGVDVEHAIASLSTYMGHVKVTDTYWYLTGIPDSAAGRRGSLRTLWPTPRIGMLFHDRSSNTSFAHLVQGLFLRTSHQPANASPRTVASCIAIRFDYCLATLGNDRHKQPSQIELSDLTPTAVAAFLNHLERGRHNTVRTRNNRFAAIARFFAVRLGP